MNWIQKIIAKFRGDELAVKNAIWDRKFNALDDRVTSLRNRALMNGEDNWLLRQDNKEYSNDSSKT